MKCSVMIFLLGVLISLMASPNDSLVTKEGTLRLFGNEPFVRIALVTEDAERWFLEMDNQNKLFSLIKEKGPHVRVKGLPYSKDFAGRKEHFLRVIEYRPAGKED